MDPAKRNIIIKNILIIISVLLFFSSIGYGIYSVLKSIGIDKPICDPGQINYSEYNDNCYEECDDDHEPCPSFKDGNEIPTRITCVPKCKDSDYYDFDPKYCNDGTCTTDSDKDNCKFYCKPKKCDSPSKIHYSKTNGWYCGTSDKPEWSDDSCPNKKWIDTNPKELNIWPSGTVSCNFTNENPIIFINNTSIKFNITLNYVLGYIIDPESWPSYRFYKDDKCQLNNVVGENGVYKADKVLACAKENHPKDASDKHKPSYESIAPEKNIYNDFTPSSQTITVLNFYSLNLAADNASLIKTLNNSYSSNTNKISLGVYNTSEFSIKDLPKLNDGGCAEKQCFKEFPLSKKGSKHNETSGFWKFEKFGCKLDEATYPVNLNGVSNFVTFKLENDPGYYFGIVTTSDNAINEDVYIGQSGVLYFGDYCKLLKADCNKLGIPDNLTENDWNVSS